VHVYEWVMVHVYEWVMVHVYEWVMVHVYEWVIRRLYETECTHGAGYMCVSLGTSVSESWRTCMSVSHGAHVWDWMHTRQRVYVCVFRHISERVLERMCECFRSLGTCMWLSAHESRGICVCLEAKKIKMSESWSACISESWRNYMRLNAHESWGICVGL